MRDADDDALVPFGAEPPLLEPAQLRAWIIAEDDDVVVFNKPGWVVCHPSKNGPFSSLVGAAREVLGLERVHLVSRLDRETSGLVILAKHRFMARQLQMALADRRVTKEYRAILEGRLPERIEVSRPMGADEASPVHVKQQVDPPLGGQKAQTTFRPLAWRDRYTLAEVIPHTGRKHQIRVHAAHLGHAVAGDKLYGPDERLYLDFVESGWTSRHRAALPLPRQALHAYRLSFQTPVGDWSWEAPLAGDLEAFWNGLPGEVETPPPRSTDPSVRRRRRRATPE